MERGEGEFPLVEPGGEGGGDGLERDPRLGQVGGEPGGPAGFVEGECVVGGPHGHAEAAVDELELGGDVGERVCDGRRGGKDGLEEAPEELERLPLVEDARVGGETGAERVDLGLHPLDVL